MNTNVIITIHDVNNIPEMLIPCDEVNILNTFRVMIILRLLLLLTNLHLKLLSTQGTGADKLLSTQRVKQAPSKLKVSSSSVLC